MAKRALSVADIEAQTAVAVPERRMMALINVFLLNGVVVQVPIAAAANICGVPVAVLSNAVSSGATGCHAGAGSGGII